MEFRCSVGSNVTLNDTCASPADQKTISCIRRPMNAWVDAGFPLDKLVLGVAGSSGGAAELAAYPPFDKNEHPLGGSWDVDGGSVDM
ncbi:hypothetical protein D9757_014732 [Collybiopsis confluens]|uniref:Uncharacterized protein n=1 Tax=Collybiopsis confluens TaxID=2823264 RepID=A0A8H5GR60_9AGAR|nr:hypothetical protein D9757_014732 [Collybiopsis confluens]